MNTTTINQVLLLPWTVQVHCKLWTDLTNSSMHLSRDPLNIDLIEDSLHTANILIWLIYNQKRMSRVRQSTHRHIRSYILTNTHNQHLKVIVALMQNQYKVNILSKSVCFPPRNDESSCQTRSINKCIITIEHS